MRAVDEEDEVRVRVEPETVSTDVTTTTEIEVDVEEVSSDVVSSSLLEVTAREVVLVVDDVGCSTCSVDDSVDVVDVVLDVAL